MKSVFVALLAALLGPSIVSAAPPIRIAAAVVSPPSEIVIQDLKFAPAIMTVSVGTTVTWVNHDKDVHTVTSSKGVFASSGLDASETFSFRFDRPGTYVYFCSIHPHMKATVVVK